MKNIYALALVFCLSLQVVFGQIPVPGPEQQESILLLGATAHLGNGKVIENSAVGFDNGKIMLVENNAAGKVDKSRFDKVIDVSGKHLYPSFIAPNTTLGLTEIDAVRATRDFRETGMFKPHVRSLIAYNTDSRITPTVRSNGVLVAQVTPRGGRIPGSSSIVHLDAWNWEDAAIRMDDGIHLNWPRTFKNRGWWAEPGPKQKNDKLDDQIAEIKSFFQDAKAYAEVELHKEQNIRFEAMRGLWNGSKTLYVNADYVKDITRAVLFCDEMNIRKVVLVGGYDSWRVTDLLKENNIAVMLNRTHSLPERPEDDVDLPYKTPFLLKQAGIEFCLQNQGDMEAMNARNIPFLAGTAAAYGLSKEEALESITLSTAKILGVANKLGSIEVGKQATLFVSTGDALDMRTNNLEYAFVDGRVVDLNNPQKELYNKYKAKYDK